MECKSEPVEIDLDCLSKEELIVLISYAHQHDLTFNQALVDILTKFLSSSAHDSSVKI